MATITQDFLDEGMIEKYKNEGFLIFNDLLTVPHIDFLSSYCEKICHQCNEKKIIESNGEPFSIYIDQNDVTINSFVRFKPLLTIVQSLLNQFVYVHQIKLNHKIAMRGSEIIWHEDFTYWHILDKIPSPNLLTMAVLLDDVNDFNSPLLLIPQSHKYVLSNDEIYRDNVRDETGVTTSWSKGLKKDNSTLVSELRYQITQKTLLELTDTNPIIKFTGKKGSVVFFHSKTIHASTKNISPWQRRMLFVTYNASENIASENENRRAAYISYRDNTPLRASNEFTNILAEELS